MTIDSKLIERIEEASGPSFALEKEIYLARYGEAARHTIPPAYTAQIDRALELVADDATGWSLNNDQLENEALIFRSGDGVIGRGNAATPALALCAAALRSRSSS